MLTVYCAVSVQADTIRVATYNVSMGRKGPGLLLRDLAKGQDAQIATVSQVIAKVAPDILLLTDFDHDHGQVALQVFASQLKEIGVSYPYTAALGSNAGLPSGLDLDGDGWLNGAGDAQGFGAFPGAQGMALLSKYPILLPKVQDYSDFLWRNLPGAKQPVTQAGPFPSAKAQAVQRLASKGFWVLPVQLPGDRVLFILASHASPPVFDGPEDQNGLRNRDEIRFWSLYLDGKLPGIPPLPEDARFVLMGDTNADPIDGEGSQVAMQAVLDHPRIQDPLPKSKGGKQAAARQGGPNLRHRTDPALDTVDWDESRTDGNMRVDYVLPSANQRVTGAGVFWPAPDHKDYPLVGSDGSVGSHHRLVWADLFR